MFTILSQLFIIERHQSRAGTVGAIPALGEVIVARGVEPLLATNMRGDFVRTRVSREGYARFGFFECLLEQEQGLFVKFFQTLVQEGCKENWGNVVHSVTEAIEKLQQRGLNPCTLVISPTNTEKTGISRVFVTDLLSNNNALVVAQAEVTGYYSRIGNTVGVLAQCVDKAFVVVQP